MKIEIVAAERQDISRLVRNVTWSGSRINVARKLELDFTHDPHCPIINFYNGYTVIATNENGEQFFEGNIYRYKKSRAEGNVHIMCLDHLHVMKVSFLANNKTGYQIIMMAYTEAHKKNEKIYQPIMNGARLDIIEKGTLIENFSLDSRTNMMNS